MKYTNLLLAIPKAFYSTSFYREVAEKWGGRSFLYLLVLLLICWIVTAGTLSLKASHGMKFLSKKMAAIEFPVIDFKKGAASATPSEVFNIKDPDTGKALIIIDTENKVQNFQDSNAFLLVQKHAIFIRDQQQHKITQYLYPKELTYQLGPKQVKNFLNGASKWIIPVVFGFLMIAGLIFSYIYRIVQILIYSLFGMIFNAILRRKLNYEALMSLSIICITPAIILSTILMAFAFHFPFQWPFYFVLSMLYLFFAIKATPKKEIPEATTSE